MDNDSERMILIGNCGVFIEYKKTRFILDGLYKDTRSFFGDIPEIMKKAMMEGKGYLANADYLFFSHAHGDHYLGEYLLKYVAHNSVKGVLLPELAQTHKNTENYKIIKNKLLNIQHNHISLASDINIVRKKCITYALLFFRYRYLVIFLI
ncbi:hypothetical protein [Acidaminococcus sp. DS4831]|uniref:hypothetical protein n=1 Tax=Acidaminococcus sp. DS4831 TaxID=3141399 RepID=UPI0032E46C85